MSTPLVQAKDNFPSAFLNRIGEVQTVVAPGVRALHESESDVFARHDGIPGHKQELLGSIRVVMAGAGGLNSWTALALLRTGIKQITVIDPDLVEVTNLARQYYFSEDRGKPKTTQLIHNLLPHATTEATITGMSMRFEDAMEQFTVPCDLLMVGVDRNDCRLYGARLAKRLGIPAIFTMLSTDGIRCNCFLQGPNVSDACLWCALPNLDPDHIVPCASSVITSCLLASGFSTFFAHRALMGWPKNVQPFNWREADLMGLTPDRIGNLQKRAICPVCSNL